MSTHLAAGNTRPARAPASLAAVALLALAAGASHASAPTGPKVGDRPPEIDAPKWYNSQPTSLGAQRGKVVLLEFWSPGWGACVAQFGHLNEIHAKYAEKGLALLSLTDSASEAFIQEKGLKYPVGVGGGNMDRYGITGIPQAYLIDHRGKVAWEGHTASEQQIEDLLGKLRPFPKRDWPKALDKAARAARAGKLGEAAKLLAKLAPQGDEEAAAHGELKAWVDGKVSDIISEAGELEKEEDYFAAKQVLDEAKKSLSGHEAAGQVSEKLKAFDKDKKIKSAVKAGAILEQAAALEQRKKVKEAIALYAQAAKIGAGTKAGEKAKAKFEELSSAQK